MPLTASLRLGRRHRRLRHVRRGVPPMRQCAGEEDGMLKKLVTVVAAPAPHAYFLRHRALHPAGKSVVLRDDRAAFARRLPRLHAALSQGAEVLFDCAPSSRRRRARACRPTTSSPGTTRRCARSRRSRHHLSAGALSRTQPARGGQAPPRPFRRRSDGPSRIRALQRQGSPPRPAVGALHDARNGSTKSSPSTRTMGAMVFNPAPLHA